MLENKNNNRDIEMIDSEFLAQYKARENMLRDKIILVTGAGDGIGKTAALTFAKYGATVILVGRTIAKLEIVYDEIEQSGYPKSAIFPINFESATEQDYTSLAEAIDREFGQMHGLLHNASELGPRSPLNQYDAELWNKVIQVNITAPFLLTKALLPLLEKDKGASIVFTGASVGRHGKAYWGGYAVSKAATENLMQVLADELDGISKIRVNSIDPGATRTRMRATAYPAEDPAQITSPNELMNRYLFLMGPDSELITGQQFDAQPADE